MRREAELHAATAAAPARQSGTPRERGGRAGGAAIHRRACAWPAGGGRAQLDSSFQPRSHVMHVLALDLGGGTVKLGLGSSEPGAPRCARLRAVAPCAHGRPFLCPTARHAPSPPPPAPETPAARAACRHVLHSVFPNASAKLKGERGAFVGEAMLGMKDVTALSLRRPVDRGFVVAWDLQREILARRGTAHACRAACFGHPTCPATLPACLNTAAGPSRGSLAQCSPLRAAWCSRSRT